MQFFGYAKSVCPLEKSSLWSFLTVLDRDFIRSLDIKQKIEQNGSMKRDRPRLLRLMIER